MIDIGNGNIYDVIDINDGSLIESREQFDQVCKQGRAALVIDLGYIQYPVLITFFADYPETPYSIHLLYGPMPVEQEADLLQKLKEVKGLREIRNNNSTRITPKLAKSFLEFIQKR